MTEQQKRKLLSQYIESKYILSELKKEQSEWQDLESYYHGGKYEQSFTMKYEMQRIKNSIENEIANLCEIREKISKEVGKIEDERLRGIIYLKYICGYTFEEIAEMQGYCVRQIIRLTNKAIKNMFVR